MKWCKSPQHQPVQHPAFGLLLEKKEPMHESLENKRNELVTKVLPFSPLPPIMKLSVTNTEKISNKMYACGLLLAQKEIQKTVIS